MEWQTLVPVAAGGIIAMIGGMSAQLLTHRLTASREARKLRTERIERMVEAVWEHSDWLQQAKQASMTTGIKLTSPDPLDKARMIQTLYFDELDAAMKEIVTVRMNTTLIIDEKEQRREAMNMSAFDETRLHPDYFDALHYEHMAAISKFVNACKAINTRR
jgi:hypothetical protein